MSQAGDIDITGSHPDIPTEFIANIGTAVPIANQLEVLGTTQAAGTSPLHTTGSGNTLTIIAQISQAIAATDATKIGFAAFDSADFTVDANGFVSFSGTGGAETLTGNTGGAISPVANNINTIGDGSITIAGAGNTLTTQLTGLTNHAVLVGAGTTTITKLTVGTNGQVLIGSTAADPVFGTLTSSDSSITFTTGAGTLSLQVAGGSTTGKTITGDTGGALSPTAGNWNLLGSGSITTSGSGSTLTTQLTGLTNHAVLVGAGTTTITKVGPTATAGQVLQSAGAAADPAFSTATYPSTTTINQILYSSATNVVSGLATANRGVLTTGATGVPVITALATDGQVIIGSTAGVPAAATLTAGTGISITNASNSITIAVNGSIVGETITGNTGGAISPSAGNWNTLGTGSITIAGAGSTLTTQLTGLTNHNVLIGAGTATITNVAPSATSGVPFISQGAAADPTFGTAVVAGGGTGNTTFTAYSVIAAGTTATGAFQNVSGVGTSGQVLTSAGAGALPTWTTLAGGGITNVVIQNFVASGTYTPTTGMTHCIVELWGAGGGGGGCAATGAATVAASGGGGSAAYAIQVFDSATIGASQTVTLGTAGTAGSAGNNAGGAGGASTFGALLSANGGSGGSGSAAATSVANAGGTAGSGSSGALYTLTGGSGGSGYGFTAGIVVGGMGGNGPFCGSFTSTAILSSGTNSSKSAGLRFGGGGTGVALGNSQSAISGSQGNGGAMIVTEFIV